ncbi:hypothetical protein PY257_01550 [Ramlibacter sp. H39-3-26]|uniref:hypothetical protein n=1 Tax=Curvibacter soli TaxID=3031331 RepID=UPI0023DB15E5|nr:hypothetical protein [Ramlibacter sp. H39-3-26]MDF1483882.1 hypothetical protein [Ramlibacter sp. H39-3-26]
MDADDPRLQELAAAVAAAIAALDELTFVLHTACDSAEARQAWQVATDALRRASAARPAGTPAEAR